MATQTLNLTKRTVDALPYSKNGRQRYKDSKLPGFFLRVGADKKVYFVEKKINGKPIKFTIGAHNQITTEQARKEAQRLLGEMATGRNPAAEKKAKRQGRITLKTVFEDFLSTRKELSEKTVYDYTRIMETVFKDWQSRVITEINKDMVSRKHKSIGEKNGQAYSNLAMRFLRALFNFAAGKYETAESKPLIQENPVKVLSQTRAWYRISRRQTIIKPDDLPAWFKAVQDLKNHTARDYLIFVLLTGCRKREGLNLEVSQVDLQAKTFTFPDTKNRKPLTLPLPSHLYSVIKKRIDNVEDAKYVFPGNGKDGKFTEPRQQVAKVVEKSEVAFMLHDLRRLFITTAESLDIPTYAVKMLVNHSTGSDVTGGYIIPDVERLRKPMQKIEDKLLTLAGARGAGKVVPLSRVG
ncbi:MAG: tyrosine-type recombinase/integrase [Nitrospirales bacterium]